MTFADGSTATAVFNLPAVLIAALVTALLVRGVQESATVNAVMVVDQSRGRPAGDRRRRAVRATRRTTRRSCRRTPATFGEFGWSGIFRGAAVIFFAYIGFDAVSTAAQEARNPQRDMPSGILGSLAICTVLYVAVVGGDGRSRAVSRARRSGADGGRRSTHARAAASGHGLGAGSRTCCRSLVKIGIIAGLTSTMVVQMMAQPRIFMAMAQRRPAAGVGRRGSIRASARRT